ncbi:uncharacterized protein PITG_00130 [Phytophthora infestans T30-4]|uniref:WRKY19-like zinc finger domain-containing protein n=1 Tax=Phytophthora infestans (strain T30-4) TaxID=403677 RepID=D0MSY7_PHYIT|nr:uncharacterized protein PITG_00130 [Phytophthora infestans T30-4]EEY57571.1 conserved hypothetical protein [Phytophthora infestans T30-4]|eukprot:XP_002908757.1 conserved hypothetical protein [Phytophthora infestans T30-4]
MNASTIPSFITDHPIHSTPDSPSASRYPVLPQIQYLHSPLTKALARPGGGPVKQTMAYAMAGGRFDSSTSSDDDENVDRSNSFAPSSGPAFSPLRSTEDGEVEAPDCYRTIRGPSGTFCKYHKQSRFCRAEGCSKSAKTGGFCISHGGGKRCAHPDCNKSAKQGGLCISHGGGKRCSEVGCTKSALVGGFCSAHGGGRKCKMPECTKTALLGGLCIAHGGGKRCQIEGCSKSAVGGTLCVSHGGGKRCQAEGCNKGAVRNGVCIRHGAKREQPSMAP